MKEIQYLTIEEDSMFCRQCGNQLSDDSDFCTKCTHSVGNVSNIFITSSPSIHTNHTMKNHPHTSFALTKRTSVAISALWYFLFIAIFIGSGYLLFRAGIPLPRGISGALLFPILGLALVLLVRGGAKVLPILVVCVIPAVLAAGTFGLNSIRLQSWTPGGAINGVSSAVSLGVSPDDLGNVLNGQYYFDDGTAVYYSSWDQDNDVHIYRKDKKNGTTTSIFDGFGWSLVVNQGWLYFSGNTGTAIDNTYHLFRMKTDGTQLDVLDERECSRMSFYKNWLYYFVKQADETYSIERLKLSDSTHETIKTNTWSAGIIFENHLYYLDNTGSLFSANPDGTDPLLLHKTKINQFIIGNGDLYYVDYIGCIWTSNTDGSNPKRLRNPGSNPIMSISSFKNTVFFADYDATALEGRSAFQYYIHSINADGTGGKDLYSGVSQGCWMNLVGGKLFVLDFAIEKDTGIWLGIVKEMSLGGGATSVLPNP
jgi:hypothetical protein